VDALVIIPEAVSYFYELVGHRLRDSLQAMGHATVLARLHTFDVRDYDWCFLVNVADIMQGFLRTQRGNLDQAKARFSVIHQRTRIHAHVLLESVTTSWYSENMRWCDGLQIRDRIDMGYHRQDGRHSARTHFLFNGLMEAEQRHLHDLSIRPSERRIPWVFIGTNSSIRADVARRLIDGVDSRGFLYLRNPQGEAVGWTGPHLNYEQYLRVHQKAQFSVWCSHHGGFYIESERFRLAALAGAVPVKILTQPLPTGVDVPFRFLMLTLANFECALRAMDYETSWYQFRDECLRLPTLEQSLAGVMEAIDSDG
jgi:hypothetical protein